MSHEDELARLTRRLADRRFHPGVLFIDDRVEVGAEAQVARLTGHDGDQSLVFEGGDERALTVLAAAYGTLRKWSKPANKIV